MFYKEKSTLPYKLIDNHIHGSFGINFNIANYDEIKFLLSEFYKKGLKGICPTLVGDVDEKIYNQLKLFKQIKKEQLENSNSEALILGVHLEGTFLSPINSGIQNKQVFKKPSVGNFENLVKDCIDIIKIVTIAPEEDIDLISYFREDQRLKHLHHYRLSIHEVHHRLLLF